MSGGGMEFVPDEANPFVDPHAVDPATSSSSSFGRRDGATRHVDGASLPQQQYSMAISEGSQQPYEQLDGGRGGRRQRGRKHPRQQDEWAAHYSLAHTQQGDRGFGPLPPYGAEATGGYTAVPSSLPPYVISPTAPRLYVPSNLPVRVTSLIDLVAQMVCRAGPNLEDELLRREGDNPNFRFLRIIPSGKGAAAQDTANRPWLTPENIYYRWRVYSLLNGDTQTHWRTEPFQIEHHPDAYVIVPPPLIPQGPESLALLWKRTSPVAPPQDAKTRSGTAAAPAVTSVGAPQPSEKWVSRVVVARSARVFHCCTDEERAEWLAMLDPLPEMQRHTGDAQPPTAEQRERLLSSSGVARRMSYVLDRPLQSQHLLCLLLDKVVALAAESAQLLESNPRGVGLTDPPAVAAISLQSTQLLWYLFILHDIIMNCCIENDTAASHASGVGDSAASSSLTATSPPDASGSAARKVIAPLYNAIQPHSAAGSHTGVPHSGGRPSRCFPLTDEDMEAAREAGHDMTQPIVQRPLAKKQTSSIASSSLPTQLWSETQLKDMLCSAVEMILPTFIEAMMIALLANLQVIEPADKAQLSVSAPEPEDEIVITRVADGTAAPHNLQQQQEQLQYTFTARLTSETEQRDPARAEAFRLSVFCYQWLKQLVKYWGSSATFLTDAAHEKTVEKSVNDFSLMHGASQNAVRDGLSGRFASLLHSKYKM